MISVTASGDTTAGGTATFTASLDSGDAADTLVWVISGDATDLVTPEPATGQGTMSCTVAIPAGATVGQTVTATLTATNKGGTDTKADTTTVTALRAKRRSAKPVAEATA